MHLSDKGMTQIFSAKDAPGCCRKIPLINLLDSHYRQELVSAVSQCDFLIEAYNYVGFMWAEHNMHLDEAEEMIGRALQLDPNNGAYLDSLGWVHFRKGKYEDALKELLRAAQNLTRDDPVVLEHIGDAYSKLNRIPQALDYWQKAITLNPENKLLAEKIENTKTTISKGPPSKINR